jgi:hypothetical protein
VQLGTVTRTFTQPLLTINNSWAAEDAKHVFRRKRRSIMSQDVLVIGKVVLVAWGLATAAMVLD